MSDTEFLLIYPEYESESDSKDEFDIYCYGY